MIPGDTKKYPQGNTYVPSPEKTPSIQMETQKRRHGKKSRVGNASGNYGSPFFPGDHLLSGGPRKPSPGGRLPMLPARRVGLRRLFFRRRRLGLPCGAVVAKSRGHGRLDSARVSRCPSRPTKTEYVFEDPMRRHDYRSVLFYTGMDYNSSDTLQHQRTKKLRQPDRYADPTPIHP